MQFLLLYWLPYLTKSKLLNSLMPHSPNRFTLFLRWNVSISELYLSEKLYKASDEKSKYKFALGLKEILLIIIQELYR